MVAGGGGWRRWRMLAGRRGKLVWECGAPARECIPSQPAHPALLQPHPSHAGAGTAGKRTGGLLAGGQSIRQAAPSSRPSRRPESRARESRAPPTALTSSSGSMFSSSGPSAAGLPMRVMISCGGGVVGQVQQSHALPFGGTSGSRPQQAAKPAAARAGRCVRVPRCRPRAEDAMPAGSRAPAAPPPIAEAQQIEQRQPRRTLSASMPPSDSSFSSSASRRRPGLRPHALASAHAPPRFSWLPHASRLSSAVRPTSACGAGVGGPGVSGVGHRCTGAGGHATGH